MFPRNAWYIAAWADEVADKPLARRIGSEPVVLFRGEDGIAAALADRCCHRSAPLSLGRVVAEGIECGYHGLVIDGAGRCVKVPGQRLIPSDATVRSYPLVEKNQFLWIWLGETALADPALIVDFPYHDDAARWPHKHTMYPIKAITC
jgi:phenylpropionate dioxygenase-like ring-hydroxylating dioxygenase large terminal subunit